MKPLSILLLFTLLFGFAKAQKVFSYTDSLHLFKVTIDTNRSTGTDDYSVQSITVYTKKDHKLVQTITPLDNSFFSITQPEQVFLLDDINFDGLTDFRIMQFTPAAPNMPYYYWKYNKVKKRFQRDTTLEEITSPDFDPKAKTITCTWRASCCDHGCSTYKYINGKITLIEVSEYAEDSDHSGQMISTTKKLVNGKMKLIKRTVEKVE